MSKKCPYCVLNKTKKKGFRLNTEKSGMKSGNNLAITMVYVDKNSEC
jgi:hypothetical protein